MDIQVKKEHYSFENYVDIERWNSYYNQVFEIKKNNRGGIVLIIGKGDGIVGTILENVYGIRNMSFDYDTSLEPDIVGDVTKITNYFSEKFETVVCCQVLEHIPYESFENTIKNISNVCSDIFILSLPIRSFQFSFSFKIPNIKRRVINIIIPRFYEKNVPWKGQHYWEVGTRGKSVRNISGVLERYFEIKKKYIYKENPYHYFWVLKKRE